jgi:hypothetical protein
MGSHIYLQANAFELFVKYLPVDTPTASFTPCKVRFPGGTCLHEIRKHLMNLALQQAAAAAYCTAPYERGRGPVTRSHTDVFLMLMSHVP